VEAVAASGSSPYAPSVFVIAAALVRLIANPASVQSVRDRNGDRAGDRIGGGIGLVIGLLLGSNRFLGDAFEPISPRLRTPKIIILPIVYLMFGVGPTSKVAMGPSRVSFHRVERRTGMHSWTAQRRKKPRSFIVADGAQIYLPALVEPVATGLRMGLGAAIAVCLIAEIKFSSSGLGAMIIDSFNRSRFAEVYAVLIVIVALAVAGNMLVDRLGQRRRARR
jgi:ABC-type nitrate/sulfonate/bicarbonate transport system permease component